VSGEHAREHANRCRCFRYFRYRFCSLCGGTPTEEEKFAALKAAVEEGFAQIDAGLGIRISSLEEHEAFINELSERAGKRARARREAQQLARVS